MTLVYLQLSNQCTHMFICDLIFTEAVECQNKRERWIMIFSYMYIALPYPISHGYWLKQEKLGLVLASRTHLNGLTTSVQAPPYLIPRLYDCACVYHTECLGTRLAPPLIQIHKVVVYIVSPTFSDFHTTC